MNILLPIETINREIDFKIVLASLLSGKNHKIFIGQHNFLNALTPKFLNGIYVGKNIFNKRSDIDNGEIYKKLKSNGIDLIYLHEEGAVFKGGEESWKMTLARQYNLDFFDQNDIICTWGNFQQEFDNSRSRNLKIETTGHPRFDLYKKQWRQYFHKEVREIKEIYSDYILINGNYGLYNHGLGVDFVFSAKAGYNPIKPANRMDRINFFTNSGIQCLSMVQLTHQLSIKYPKINFIYRPHPSENQTFYETVFKDVKNIHVRDDGPVSAWILASQAIIHDGCTTALEASFADKPVINYKTIDNNETDIWLPNQIGTRCISFQEVTDVFDNLNRYNFNVDKIENKNKVKNLLFNFENDSYAKLLEVIEEKIQHNYSSESLSPSTSYIKFEYSKMRAKQNLYQLQGSKSKKASNYHNRKFYGLDEKYIEEKFKTMGEILDKVIKFKYHNPYLIEIK